MPTKCTLELTPRQLNTLRHMLGIETPNDRVPKPSRDYYCANPGDEKLAELERLGAVECYDRAARGYDWFRCTAAGRIAAMASHRTIRRSKSQRVYVAFLRCKDCFADLSFREFLTHPDFADTRRAA